MDQLCVAAVAVIGGGTAFMSRTKAKAAKGVETTYTTASVKSEHHQCPHRQRYAAARRFLHRHHAGIRRGSQRHI